MPADFTTIAQLEYDKLGQLKSKKLGTNNLETLNYEYNIRGWLLGMNRDYLLETNPSINYFGFELGYDKLTNNAGRNFSAGAYNGNINGMIWKSKGDQVRRKYDFGYDAANRLLKGDFEQNDNGSAWGKSIVDYTVKMGDGSNANTAYDNNGNIKSMQQWGFKIGGSSQIEHLGYQYNTGSNKLLSVSEVTLGAADNKLGDFTDKNTTNDDYDYDENGNLKYDKNKDVSSISHNLLNLPEVITVIGKGTITYTYDAAGIKLKKITVDNTVTPAKTAATLYTGGLVYENDVLQFVSHEEGRIRFTPAAGATAARLSYDYFIKDHLGNVRMVLTGEQKAPDVYQAGMEDANRSFEVSLFGDKINQTVADKPGMNGETEAFDADNTNNKKVSKVSGGTAESRIGPGVILKVMAGDKIKASTYAWYQPTTTDNSIDQSLAPVVFNLLGQLTPGISALAKGGAASQVTNNILQPGMESLLNNQAPTSGAPKAFLNYVLLDEEQFKAVKYGATPVPVITSGMQKQLLQSDNGSDIEMPQNGYLYVFVSNESKGDVFFDDIRIEHARGALLEETHYYPFGLTMAGISSKAMGALEIKHKFNGIEQNTDFDINMYEALFRNLDPQTGRFWQIDPKPVYGESPYSAMLNNPIELNDPLGDTTWLYSSGGHYLGHVPDKLDNQIHYMDSHNEKSSQIDIKGLNEKQLNDLATKVREMSIAFIGKNSVDDLQIIYNDPKNKGLESLFVGQVGDNKEIRFSQIDVPGSERGVDYIKNAEKWVEKQLGEKLNTVFNAGHFHPMAALVEEEKNGFRHEGQNTAKGLQRVLGYPSHPKDYTNQADLKRNVSNLPPYLIGTPVGFTLYKAGEFPKSDQYYLSKQFKK